MKILNWHSMLLIGLYLAPLISALIYLQQSENKRHAQILLTWVTSSILMTVPTTLGFAGFFNTYPNFRYLPIYALTLSGPLLIGYILSMTRQQLPKWLAVTLAFPALELTYRLILFFLPEPTQQFWLLSWHTPVLDDLITAVGAGLMLYAGVFVILESKKYKTFLLGHTSQQQDYFAIAIFTAAITILLLSLFWVYLETYELLGGVLSHKQEYPFYIGLLLLSYLMSQISIVSERYRLPKQFSSVAETETKYSSNVTPKRALQQLISEQLYLKPRLNLSTAAELLDISKNQLTGEIQAAKFNNFNHCINVQRIEYAKSLLVNSDKDILEIGFESGFNSKASFNRAFKELASLSPTEFRAQHQ